MWKDPSYVKDELDWDDSSFLSPPGNPTAPRQVAAAPRLSSDLQSLAKLLAAPAPPVRYLRPHTTKVAIYGFVDASGAGFGSSFTSKHKHLLFRHGIWGRDADNVSSNYKELCNLLEAIEDGLLNHELQHTELFIFTDNSTAEGAYYKGNTNSKLLFDLVLRLRQIEMDGLMRLHIVHVAGTRMIAQGTDGLSRGDLTEGVLQGTPMASFIPLHLSALQRSPSLLSWIQSWCPVSDITPLEPCDWYDRGHGICDGFYTECGLWHPIEVTDQWFLWTPPPAAGAAALDELGTSRHKRPHLNHIFICPRLMTQHWRRKLHRTADLVIELPAGRRSFWSLAMHEPLVIGLTLRFSSCPPWQLRRSSSLLELERALRQMWRTQDQDERGILRQLCHLPAVLEALPQGLVR